MVDRQAVKAVPVRSPRGSDAARRVVGQALVRSRGGFATKIHAKSDASGGIIAFGLTGGEACDGRHFETLFDLGLAIRPRAVICDKGDDRKTKRNAARKRGMAPLIPPQSRWEELAGLHRPPPLRSTSPHRTAQAL
ncbi:hypothetical protein [Lichenibacterium dinghuense]|uniref:hypothetical protein n=1 Tax=Lichenibacterium dinghuense TaxID=2895977 RepID=UPI003D17F9E8